MSLELHIFKSKEFLKFGAHGELDWASSRSLLSRLVKATAKQDFTLAIIDVRDASRNNLTDEQIADLGVVFAQSGLRGACRLAILHLKRPNPKADIFAGAAVGRGLEVGSFDSFEQAVEWLSASREPDPDFDRAVYIPPEDRSRTRLPPEQG